jgi:hypothetical protein
MPRMRFFRDLLGIISAGAFPAGADSLSQEVAQALIVASYVAAQTPG